jgi:hypothetical protein
MFDAIFSELLSSSSFPSSLSCSDSLPNISLYFICKLFGKASDIIRVLKIEANYKYSEPKYFLSTNFPYISKMNLKLSFGKELGSLFYKLLYL